jgi:hypothetical protein
MLRVIRSLFGRSESGLPQGSADGLRQKLWHFLVDPTEPDFMAACGRYGFSPTEIASLLDLRRAARTGRRAFDRLLDTAGAAERAAWPFELPSDPRVQQEQLENRKRLEDFVRDKRVVLTGPSQHIAGTGMGAAIDGHDIVVRLNFQWPLPAALTPDFGERMDILYHCSNGDYAPDTLLQAAAGRLRFACLEPNPLSLRMKRTLTASGTCVLYVSGAQEECRRKLLAPPSTGILAVHDLLSLPLQSLSVVGMTCWATRYCTGYQGRGAAEAGSGRFPDQVWMHRPAAEAKLLLALAATDPRLTIDPQAADIMQQALRFTSV